jgi:hypothetical protein
MNKNKLNIKDFFSAIADEKYVIIKLASSFPDYCSGSDVDILCSDIKKIIDKILTVGNRYVEDGFRICVTTPSEISGYVDFYEPNSDKIEFRFDLHGSLPDYNKIHLSPSYFFIILETRKKIAIEHNDSSFSVFIPSYIDDILLRYIEFIEWYEQRPDKIKHLEYVLNKLKNDKEREEFLDRLHLYTKAKLTDIPMNTYLGNNILKTYGTQSLKIKNEIISLKREISGLTSEIDGVKSILLQSNDYAVGRTVLLPLRIAKKIFRLIKRLVIK